MRLNALTLVTLVSSLFIFGCNEDQPPSLMPVTTDSELAQELYETGIVAYDHFNRKLALESLYEAVELDQDFFMAYFWMYYMSSKDSKMAAEKALQSEARLSDGEEQVRSALKYLVDGQNDKVVEHLQNLVDMYPYDPQTHKILYLIQQMYFKDIDGAIVTLKRAIRDCPDYPLAYNQLGYAYMDLDDYENAGKILDTYIKLAPDQANPYDSKGDYFMATEQFQEAYDSYMRAFEIDSVAFEVSRKKAEKARMMMAKEAI